MQGFLQRLQLSSKEAIASLALTGILGEASYPLQQKVEQ
jgi:hypothetical protein